MLKIDFNGQKIFYELDGLAKDPLLVQAVKKCVEAQRNAAREKLKKIFKPNPAAIREVSPEALDEILKTNQNINGIRTEGYISNVIVFNDKRYENAVFSDEITVTRKKVDEIIRRKMGELFGEGKRLEVRSSGFFLYPPQAYMGWHTNWQNPGWRLYINYADEPGRSFFRYRDPGTGEIVTSADKQINFRLFRALKDKPFWHTVYSETNRFSLGYKISKRSDEFVQRLKKKLSQFRKILRIPER